MLIFLSTHSYPDKLKAQKNTSILTLIKYLLAAL